MSTGKTLTERASQKLLALARLLGERIVQLRRGSGLNQQQLAVRAQISKGLLSTIENGQRVASLGVLKRVADALGLSGEHSLIDLSDPNAQSLFGEIYEGSSPVSMQLRSGQDVKLAPVANEPPIQEAELVPADKATAVRSSEGQGGGSADLQRVADRLLGLTEMQQELLQGLAELNARTLRNFTGVAHHLDSLMERVSHVVSTMSAQTEALAALQAEWRASRASPPTEVSPAPPAQAELVALREELGKLGTDVKDYQRGVAQLAFQQRLDLQHIEIRMSQNLQRERKR